MITPAHAELVDAIVGDLRASIATLKSGVACEGSAAMYGMLGKMESREGVADLVLEVLDRW
jgi:hypothetical protein